MGKAPSPVGCAADLSPQGEVKRAWCQNAHHLSLRGRGRRTAAGEGAFPKTFCKLGLLFAALILASPALADGVLPIAGAFGNGAGCTLFMTGQRLDSDTVVLTPDNFVADSENCHFLELSNGTETSFTVRASCGTPDPTTVSVRQADEEFYVAIGTAKEWGPLAPCPGAERAFASLGTRV